MKGIFIVFRKELKDTIRDRRAVLIALLFPLILFPALLFIMSDEERSGSMLPGRILCSVKNGQRIIDILKSGERIEIIESVNSLEDLESGKVHAAVSVQEDFPMRPSVTLICDNTRQSSVSSCAYILSLLDSHKDHKDSGSGEDDAFIVKTENLTSDEIGAGKVILSLLVPLLLLVFSSAAPLAPAADLGAGEKERASIQGLLAVPVKREYILAGKYLAVIVISSAWFLSLISGISLAFMLNPDFSGAQDLLITINTSSVLLIILFAVLLIMIFSAVEMTISLFAGTIKEAQIIIIPVLITAAACGYGAVFYDPMDIPYGLYNIPLLNISLVIKELSLDIINWPGIILTTVWTVLWIILLFFIAKYIFSREKIIYYNQ